MAKAIHIYIRDKEADTISVEHVFYGHTEQQADKVRQNHLAGCSNYALAEQQQRVFECVEEIPAETIPSPEDFEDEDDEEEEIEEVIDVEGDEVTGDEK